MKVKVNSRNLTWWICSHYSSRIAAKLWESTAEWLFMIFFSKIHISMMGPVFLNCEEAAMLHNLQILTCQSINVLCTQEEIQSVAIADFLDLQSTLISGWCRHSSSGDHKATFFHFFYFNFLNITNYNLETL